MKTKRKRNGIKTVMFTVRLDEDIHQWLKKSGTNASQQINDRLRRTMNRWYSNQQTMQFEIYHHTINNETMNEETKCCAYCANSRELFYINPEEETNFKHINNWIWCTKLKECLDITDECKNFEEETQLPF